MECNKHDDIIKMVEGISPLLPYQKQMVKIQICGNCNVVSCEKRLVDKNTLEINCLVLPRQCGIHMTDLYEASKRTASPNVMR